MASSSPPPAASAATCLPYAQASPAYISCALVYLQQELISHFPGDTLDWLTWAKALDQLRPDLWVLEEGGRVVLAEPDVSRLAQQMNGSAELPTLRPPLYGPQAAYLAKRLVTYADEAQKALDELEAQPTAYGPRAWELVLTLALGNAVADEVFRATTWVGNQDGNQGEEPAAANPTVQARVLALRQARGQSDLPTGPSPPARVATKTRPKK